MTNKIATSYEKIAEVSNDSKVSYSRHSLFFVFFLYSLEFSTTFKMFWVAWRTVARFTHSETSYRIVPAEIDYAIAVQIVAKIHLLDDDSYNVCSNMNAKTEYKGSKSRST